MGQDLVKDNRQLAHVREARGGMSSGRRIVPASTVEQTIRCPKRVPEVILGRIIDYKYKLW